MCQLSMQGQQLVAGRVVLANISPLDRYRALLAFGVRPAVAQAVLAGLVTMPRAA